MSDFSKIKKLFGITAPQGFSSEEIETIKSTFGVLPQVLIDYYAELGKEELLNQTQDSLLLPDDFKHFKNDDYLIFYCENQRCCVWAIRKDDLAKKDPPVYMSYDEKDWKQETETLTDFLHAMAYLQAIFALDYMPETFRYIENKDLELIRKNFKEKNVSFKQWTEGIEFFSNYDDSIIVVMGGGEQLIYSSASEAHFDEMHKFLSELGDEM